MIDNSNFNLVEDKLYSWYSEWCQGPGPFSYTLYMIYPGDSNATILSSNLYLPNLVGASPYNINIVDSICGDKFRTGTEAWDDGNKNNGDGWNSVWNTESGWTWTGGSQSNKDTCNEICGDGIRFNTITTYWDDGNKNSGDGWTSVWSTQKGWTWSGGSQSNKDIWSEICGDGIRFNTITTYWDDGNKNNGDGWDLACKVENGWKWTGGTNITKDIWNGDTTQETISAAAVGAFFGVVVIFSLWNISAPQGIWISMNQFQLILLLLLTKSNIPKLIQNYLSGLKATTWSFNIIPFKNIPGLRSIILYFDFSLQNKDLDIFGIFSGSTIVNNFSFVCIMLIIGLIQVLFTLMSKWFKKANSVKVKKWLVATHQFFNYSIYIRFAIEVNQFMLLSCTSEIKRWNTSNSSNIISLIISFVIVFVCGWFIIISFLSWTKYEISENVSENYPFKEFFNGITLKSSAKLYSTIFMLRRMTLVSLLIFGSSLSNIYLVIPMIVCQTVYLILVVSIRPFKEVKNNVIEISNEWFYLILVSMLAYYNETSRWSQSIQSVYLGIIIMNSLTIISVLICKLLIFNFYSLTSEFLFCKYKFSK